MPKLLYFFIIFFILHFFNPLLVIAADTVAPVSTFDITPQYPNGEDGWYTTRPEITITASDNSSGVKSINYKINDGQWQKFTSFSGLNLILNPSFEYGYISDWDFVGPYLSVGYKSSLFQHSGNYSAGVISLSPFFDSYFVTTVPINVTPNTDYSFSLYLRSITSFLDNAFVEFISVSGTNSSKIYSQRNIDLKFNYQPVSGTITTNSWNDQKLYIRIGIRQIGHLSIDDVFLAPAGGTPSVSFLLTNEGVNTIQFYADDLAGNVENIKQAAVKLDSVLPVFSNFSVTDQTDIKKFRSRITISDSTSGVVADPLLFNYSVNGINDGYFENYAECSGDFLEDSFLTPATNFVTGANSGTITTPVIDYCDSNWVNCKKLNFYAKDLAGNVSSHLICVNGPYITTNFGNVFGRLNISQMGIGTEHNVWGMALSANNVDDILLFNGLKTSYYSNINYLLNDLYQILLKKYDTKATVVSELNLDSGVFKIENDYTLNSPISYVNTLKVIFVNGNLNINQNIVSNNSNVVFLVNGNIYISNNVTQLDAGLIATNEIYTAENFDLAEKITINGFLYGRNIVFNRNTDRTLGSSEIVNYPILNLFNDVYLREVKLYRSEDRN